MTETVVQPAKSTASHSPGCAVVATGTTNDGEAAVALWYVDEAGRPFGAWIVPQARAYGDRDAARQLLTCLERRAVTAADVETGYEVMGKLTVAAEADLPPAWWEARTFCAADGLADVVHRRTQLQRTVVAQRDSGGSAAPLRWTCEFDDRVLPRDHEGLRLMARVAPVADSGIASEALTVVGVLRWVVDLWDETEQAKNRRRCLLDEHGPVETLPSSWATARSVARRGRLPW